LSVTSDGSGTGFGRVEVGGPSGGHIDFKAPASDDYDGRVAIEGEAVPIRITGKYGVDFYAGTTPVVVANINTSGDLDITGDLNITGDYKVNGTNLQTVPTGTVSAFAGSAAPTGYALCDGSAVNTHAKAALHAVISDTYGGTAYNEGVTDQPGVTTTFNLPDLRGRVVAGLDSADNVLDETASIDGTALGKFGGDAVHTLSEAQMPVHTHGIGGLELQLNTAGVANYRLSPGSASIGATKSSGSGQAHNNVQPTIILNYIIKT
jgi:microcystin-dependent protein